MKTAVKKVFFVLLLLFSVSLIFSSQTEAASGCCSLTDPKYCNRSSGPCGSGQKICSEFIDSKGNLVFNDIHIDIDNDGKADSFNPGCFVYISAPEQVRITDFGKLFSGIVAFLLLVAFILSFIYLILGGISWVTSGGDKGNVETARNKIIAAVIGLIIVASTWALFQIVGGAIGYNILGGFQVPRLF